MNKIVEKEEVTLPPSDPTKIVLFGIVLLIVVFGVIGGWMAYAPLASSSVANGKVVIGGVKQKVQSLDGGRVKAIYINDGDIVKKDTLLIKLDDVQIEEALKNLKSQYQNTMVEYARLKAELENKNKINFPNNIDKHLIETQKSIFKTRKKSLNDERLISKKRVIQAKKQIGSLKALINSNKRRLKDVIEQKREQQILFKQRLINKLKIQELEKEENLLKGDIASKRADILRLREKIGEIETQELLSKKKFREDVLNKLVQTQSEIEKLKAQIATSEDKLKRTEIKAPIGGAIVGLKVHTIGDVIRPGADILEIVPADYKPLIVAYVNLKDIDKVKIGEKSIVTFPAFNMKNMQPIEGKVIYISADSMKNKDLRGYFYKAKIELTEKSKKELNDNNLTLVSGMPVVAMINTGNRTMLDYLIKPFVDMFRKSFNEE